MQLTGSGSNLFAQAAAPAIAGSHLMFIPLRVVRLCSQAETSEEFLRSDRVRIHAVKISYCMEQLNAHFG